MESLNSFEWLRDPAGYRLAWMPERQKNAYWVASADGWSDTKKIDRSIKLEIGTTERHGETRRAKSGLYLAGFRHDLNVKESKPSFEAVRPFAGEELVSRNLLESDSGPRGWLQFTNKYGLLASGENENWHLAGRDKRWFMYQNVEHEGAWHHLRRTLFKIYNYYPAIKTKNSKYLSQFIHWESDDVVREDEGIYLGAHKLRPSIAMRGKIEMNAHLFNHFKKPDVIGPAAFALSNFVNRYLEKTVSIELNIDTSNFEFRPTLKYHSLGAALVSEAVEFMTGHFEAKQCKVCGSWFRVGVSRNRRDRIFCSAACKMRDFRARK
jgi:hypothetical protein